MELPDDERNAGAYTSRHGTIPESRPSYEARTPQTPPRLQKKRSNAGARTTRQAQPGPQSANPQRDSADAREDQKARKGSLRNAVRRLFGRRSRDAEQQTLQVSPPRHGYHRSEPHTTLASQPELAEDAGQGDTFVRRTISTPMVPVEMLPSPAVQRIRSPYAVEFPQSAKLKPLNLGNPYTAPGSQLRRRKTLPSILIGGPEAAAVAAAVSPNAAPPVPGRDDGEIGRAVSTVGEKRRSRSASDLKQVQSESSAPRKRSDEIRYWRESFQPSVLRASGFTVVPRDDPGDEEETPMPKTEDPFFGRGESSRSPPRRALEVAGSDFASPSALGSQLSQDIEDRVAKLEAGLRSFRGELASMAADRNRRTVLIGGVPSSSGHRRASSGGRTASMLAETLQTDLGPSDYNYDYTATLRPSTSPHPPSTPPVRYTEPTIGQALSSHPPNIEDPFTSTPSPPRVASGNPGGAPSGTGQPQQQQAPQYTFRSLYEMLADERSARRRLEMQMRGLREEIANLHYQVSSASNFQSQRSSYYAAMDPQVGSSRLHALLRDTEESPPGTAQSGQQQGSTGLNARIVSRFSGSESEAGGMAESTELETPYEAYQTPIEEGSFPFSNQPRTGARNDGEMF